MSSSSTLVRNERSESDRKANDAELALSLVRDDVPFRLLRKIGLVPREGLGVARRAILFALIAWLPIIAWAAYAGRMLDGPLDEPLLQHFGVHVRCLVAIPLLVIAQGLAHSLTTQLLPWFVRSGLVDEMHRERAREVVLSVKRLRNQTLPWIVIGGIVLAVTALEPVMRDVHELRWAVGDAPTDSRFGFGGWWFVFVARPIYITLALAWLWRLVLLAILFRRIAKLDLVFVPTHADRVGGLGFIERMTTMLSPVVLAFSAVFASHWAHQVLYHDLPITAFRGPAIAFVVVTLVVFLAPFVAFIPPLMAAKRRALLEYGALVSRHGRLVHERWIERKPVADASVLEAPELGPVADTLTLYEAVQRMRPLPIGKQALMAVIVPALVPLIVVVAMRVPIKELLLKLLHALA